MIHMDWNAKSAYYVAGRCVLYVKALKDNEKVELFSTPQFRCLPIEGSASRLHNFCVSMLRNLQRIMEQTLWRRRGVKQISLRKITKYELGLTYHG